MYIRPILSKQLTINKCTLLDCTHTEILMYCVYLQYTPSVRYCVHTLFWYRQTYMTSPPPCLQLSLIIHNFLHPRLAVQFDFLDTSMHSQVVHGLLYNV